MAHPSRSPCWNSWSSSAGKKKPEKHVRSCAFCVAKNRPANPHYIGVCPWISASTKSDLTTTLPTLCLGCFRLKRSSGHKCPDYLKEGGGSPSHFCQTCQLNARLCKSPNTHIQSPIPDTFVGHSSQVNHEEGGQAATWAYQCINKGSLGSAV